MDKRFETFKCTVLSVHVNFRSHIARLGTALGHHPDMDETIKYFTRLDSKVHTIEIFDPQKRTTKYRLEDGKWKPYIYLPKVHGNAQETTHVQG